MLYADTKLCERWKNNIPVSELTREGLQFHTDSQDIDWVCKDFPFLPRQNITGILIIVNDGDYEEIYITESSNPFKYDLAIYHPLEYYQK